MTKAIFKKYLTPKTFTKLQNYADQLILWNKRINLIGSSTSHDIWKRHFFDAAALLPALRQVACLYQKTGSGCKWVDIGTGGGIPGAILAILLEDDNIDDFTQAISTMCIENYKRLNDKIPIQGATHFFSENSNDESFKKATWDHFGASGTLLDSDTRKMIFVEEMIRTNRIGVQSICSRVESFLEPQNAVISRAWAPVNTILEKTLHLDNDVYVLLKGSHVEKELMDISDKNQRKFHMSSYFHPIQPSSYILIMDKTGKMRYDIKK